MPIFRITLTVEDEISAEDQHEAWSLYRWRFQEGYYGPTWDNVEETGPSPEEEYPAEE